MFFCIGELTRCFFLLYNKFDRWGKGFHAAHGRRISMERKLVIEEPVFREDTLAGNAAVRLQSSGKPATCLLLTDEKSRLTGYLPAADLFRHAVVRHGPGVEPGVLRGTELPYGAGRSERRPPAAGKRTAGHRGGRVRPSTGYLGRNGLPFARGSLWPPDVATGYIFPGTVRRCNSRTRRLGVLGESNPQDIYWTVRTFLRICRWRN